MGRYTKLDISATVRLHDGVTAFSLLPFCWNPVSGLGPELGCLLKEFTRAPPQNRHRGSDASAPRPSGRLLDAVNGFKKLLRRFLNAPKRSQEGSQMGLNSKNTLTSPQRAARRSRKSCWDDFQQTLIRSWQRCGFIFVDFFLGLGMILRASWLRKV